MLHRRGVEIAADPLEQRLTRVAIVAEDADLDELVGEEIYVDLMQYGGSETVLSYRHDRMKRMRLRPKGAPLRRCQSSHRGILRDGRAFAECVGRRFFRIAMRQHFGAS